MIRPFDVTASDIDVLLELKPEGKVCSPATLRTLRY